MKNSNQSGIGSTIRRSVAVLLMFATLAMTSGLKAADLKNKGTDDGTQISLAHQSDQNSTLGASQAPSVDTSADDSSTLVAEHLAFYCVTIYGTFPLISPVLSGSSCYVQSYYWPYNYVYGVAE